jgi:hypothetical protein
VLADCDSCADEFDSADVAADVVVPVDFGEPDQAAVPDVEPVPGDPDGDELCVDELESGVSAHATPVPVATAAPTPNATAKAPIRPTCAVALLVGLIGSTPVVAVHRCGVASLYPLQSPMEPRMIGAPRRSQLASRGTWFASRPPATQLVGYDGEALRTPIRTPVGPGFRVLLEEAQAVDVVVVHRLLPRLAGPTCVRCRLCPTGGRYQDCAGAEAADSVSAVEPMDHFAGQSLGPMLQEGRVSDSETLRPAATNTLRSISHLARLPASSGPYERYARTLSPRGHSSLFTRPYEWRRAETTLQVNDSWGNITRPYEMPTCGL